MPDGTALIHVVQSERVEGVSFVQVEGDLLDGDAERFRRSLALAADSSPRGLVVDLRGCRFLDRGCAFAVAEAAEKVAGPSEARLHVVTSGDSVLDAALEGTWRSKLVIHHTVTSALAEADAVSSRKPKTG
jgi:anti-anti-sigma regulatory factor